MQHHHDPAGQATAARASRTSVAVALAALLLAGCALPRHTEVVPGPPASTAARSDAAVLLCFEPVFPGKPVAEAAVDNVVGAFWSAEESGRTGFTQRDAETLATNGPRLAMLAALPRPVAIGLSASGQAGTLNIDSRLMLPMGRLLTWHTSQLLAGTAPAALVCADQACFDTARASGHHARTLQLQLTRLRVAEDQPNRLSPEIGSALTVAGDGGAPRTLALQSRLDNQRITAEGLFHSDFLRVMTRLANQVAADHAQKILAAALP